VTAAVAGMERCSAAAAAAADAECGQLAAAAASRGALHALALRNPARRGSRVLGLSRDDARHLVSLLPAFDDALVVAVGYDLMHPIPGLHRAQSAASGDTEGDGNGDCDVWTDALWRHAVCAGRLKDKAVKGTRSRLASSTVELGLGQYARAYLAALPLTALRATNLVRAHRAFLANCYSGEDDSSVGGGGGGGSGGGGSGFSLDGGRQLNITRPISGGGREVGLRLLLTAGVPDLIQRATLLHAGGLHRSGDDPDLACDQDVDVDPMAAHS